MENTAWGHPLENLSLNDPFTPPIALHVLMEEKKWDGWILS